MTVEQSGDSPHPSFEDILKRQLDPLYRQEVDRQKILKDAERVISDANATIAQKQSDEFLIKQPLISEVLDRFEVVNKLHSIRDTVWRRGLIEPITEPFEFNGIHTEHIIAVGYRLFYHLRAFALIDGATNLRPIISRVPERFFPVTESQVLEIRVPQKQELDTVLVDSQVRLDTPTRFRRNPLFFPEFCNMGLGPLQAAPYHAVDAFLNKRRLENHWDIGGYKGRIEVPRDEDIKITLSRVKGSEDYSASDTFGSDEKNVVLLDQYLAQDCAERFRKGMLPYQARKFWLNYIQESDNFWNPESKDEWLKYIQGEI